MNKQYKRNLIISLVFIALVILVILGVIIGKNLLLKNNNVGSETDTAQVAESDTSDDDWANLSTTEVQLTDEGYTITESGSYSFNGSSSGQISVETTDMVEIVLNGATLSVDSRPAIYVSSNSIVRIKLAASSTNSITMTGRASSLDAAIYSRGRLIFLGEDDASLNLKTTTGSGVAAENIEIISGNFSVSVSEKAFTANSALLVSGGKLNISNCEEGLEAAQLTLAGGSIDIYATDDGVNASSDDSNNIYISITGGEINIEVADGDTDAVDSNGDIYMSGGTINIKATSAFDFDGSAYYTGGTIYVNGSKVDKIENSMMPTRR